MATEPGPSTAERPPSDPYQLDRRLIILETRFDTILPTLATKADLSELKSELKALLLKYFVTMVLGFAGIIVTMVSLLRR